MSDATGRSSFVLSDDARNYFDKIGGKWANSKGSSKSGKFSTYVEPYYLCMLMGMKRGLKGAVASKPTDMVDSWVGKTASNHIPIDALAFYMKCKSKGLIGDEADDRILREMTLFFHDTDTKKYSKEAYKMMNRFSQGGFEYIREEYPQPKEMADFISAYMKILEE